MKRAYVRPTMVGERFVANEYVAACGDIEHGNYKFECNAGKKYPGVLNYHYKVRTKSGEVLPGKYGPCNATHEAPTNGDFIEGYIDDVYTIPDENIPVFIWIKGGTNVYCTTNLKRESWETTKS